MHGDMYQYQYQYQYSCIMPFYPIVHYTISLAPVPMHLPYPSCSLALPPAPTQTGDDLAPQGIFRPLAGHVPKQVRPCRHPAHSHVLDTFPD